jgi:hypothetical protein
LAASTRSGTKTLVRIPPRRRSNTALGKVFALLYASATKPVPRAIAITAVRTKPVTRETSVPAAITPLACTRPSVPAPVLPAAGSGSSARP